MTLLTISRAAADEVGIDRPSSVIGSTQGNDQRLLRFANSAGKALMKRVAWQALRKEKTFTSVATEEQTSILPSDFDRMVPETFWNRTDYKLISGPVSAVEWQGLKAFSYAGDPKFAYRGNVILVTPTLDAGESLAFEYVSNQWCETSGGTGQTAWAADTDVGVLDEELLTRAVTYLFLTAAGFPNGAAAVSFQDYLSLLVANDQPGAGIMTAADIFGGPRHFEGAPPGSGGTNLNVL